jgi:hypothetical protein
MSSYPSWCLVFYWLDVSSQGSLPLGDSLVHMDIGVLMLSLVLIPEIRDFPWLFILKISSPLIHLLGSDLKF